jgi:hypothetical protein
MAVEPVYVVCDRYGKPTPTGMAMDLGTLTNNTNTFSNNRTQCSHCENLILWSKAELWPQSVVDEKFPN